MCAVVLPPGINPIAVNKYIKISNIKRINTFVTIYRSIILKMKNVPGERCRENHNTHFMANNFFPKVVPFVR